MNIFNNCFYIFLVCFFIYSCSGNYDGFYKSPLVHKNISLQQVGNFVIHNTKRTNYTIGKLQISFAINNDCSLYAFYDTIKHHFIITDVNGAIKNIISRQGRGPSEILKATSFSFNKQNQLVVYDNPQRMLKIFNQKGAVIQYAKVKKSLYPLSGDQIYPHHQKIYVPTVNSGALGDWAHIRKKESYSKLIGVYNFHGALIDTIGQYDSSIRHSKAYDNFPVINVDFKKNRILSSHHYNYRIQIYDLNSKKRRAWFGHKTDHFHESDQYISPTMPSKKQYRLAQGVSDTQKIFSIDNMIFLYFEILTKSFFETVNFNKKKPYLVAYNSKNHACYGEIKLPYILGSVAGNKLYLIENSNPDHFTVGVYEITEGP